jgi:hypothetical protein
VATYVEPILRARRGIITKEEAFRRLFRRMAFGLPGPGDMGLDRTHTWGRTYWGGALFCLVADVAIRRQTHNRKGLRDALRAIVEHGGTIDQNWDLPKALAIGDTATGTHVLTRQYADWKDKPVPVDLPALWAQLGVRLQGDDISLAPIAPLAHIRDAIAGEHLH